MNLRSLVARFLTLFGTILIILTIYLGFVLNNELREKVKGREAAIIKLDAELKERQQRLVNLESGPLDKIVSMEAITVKLVGEKTKITVEESGESTQKDAQLYDFSLWIDVPNNRKNDIESVEYRRKNGAVLQKVLSSKEPTNGFGVSYKGWGCFPIIEVTIKEKSGEITKMSFNQCDKTRLNQ